MTYLRTYRRPAMTTNKPEVMAWYTPATRYTLPVVVLDDRSQRGEPLIRLSDYEALQAECEKLRKDISAMVEALKEFSYGLHQTNDGEDDCRCSQCRFIRMRDAALAKVTGRQPMMKSNPENPKYLWGQRVIVDNNTIAIFRHYENENTCTEQIWVELPDGLIQWRAPHNVKPLPGGQL